MRNIYIIGSLRDPKVPEIAASIREDGHDVFDDWFAAGEVADDRWMGYEQTYRKRTLGDALRGRAAKHVFDFDKTWLDWADSAVLVLPAGKSAHLELGYMAGKGKDTYVLLDGEPERYDVMYQFATAVYTNLDDLRKALLNGNDNAQSREQTTPTGRMEALEWRLPPDAGHHDFSLQRIGGGEADSLHDLRREAISC